MRINRPARNIFRDSCAAAQWYVRTKNSNE